MPYDMRASVLILLIPSAEQVAEIPHATMQLTAPEPATSADVTHAAVDDDTIEAARAAAAEKANWFIALLDVCVRMNS